MRVFCTGEKCSTNLKSTVVWSVVSEPNNGVYKFSKRYPTSYPKRRTIKLFLTFANNNYLSFIFSASKLSLDFSTTDIFMFKVYLLTVIVITNALSTMCWCRHFFFHLYYISANFERISKTIFKTLKILYSKREMEIRRSRQCFFQSKFKQAAYFFFVNISGARPTTINCFG